MIIIDLIDLVSIIPDLVNLFLSGFVFMIIFTWLNNMNVDISLFTLLSLFLSVFIKALASTIHSYFFVNTSFNIGQKIVIYVIIAILMAFVFTKIWNSKPFKNLTMKANNRTPNSDIFNDVIDYKDPPSFLVSLKSSGKSYAGVFLLREEKGLDSWIALINYFCFDEYGDVLVNTKEQNKNSIIMFNLNDIEQIQIVYSNESETWKSFGYERKKTEQKTEKESEKETEQKAISNQ